MNGKIRIKSLKVSFLKEGTESCLIYQYLESEVLLWILVYRYSIYEYGYCFIDLKNEIEI